MSNQDYISYPNSAFPPITSPLLIWLALICVLLGEFGAGLVGFWGAKALWENRNTSSDDFNKAKTYAVLSSGIAVATWFGLFMVIGGAYFQMWQTAAEDASLRGYISFFHRVHLLWYI